jgi:AcrR family transcriptional regulator
MVYSIMAAPSEGLRARKKRATRDAIAASARRLFAERGFDAVTVAEVAAAADVSEKTVFNHFATKEDLVFGGGETRLAELQAAIAERPAGTSVLDVFRANSEAMLDAVAAGAGDDRLVVPRIVRDSPTLQRKLAAGWEHEAATLVAVVAAATGADDDDLVPAVVARTLAWTLITIFRAAFDGLLAGEDPEQLAARLRPQAARAYDRLAAGLGDYGTSDRAAPPA